MDKNRFETLKGFENLDPTVLFNHFLSVDDFKWLIEQAEKLHKVECEIDNSDMGTAVQNIIEIIKG